MATTTTTMKAQYETDVGWPHPLGAIPDATGVRFTLYARHATAVDLLIFDEHDDEHPLQIIPLDPQVNKSFHFWHVYVKGAKPGMHYAYRVDGPNDEDSLRRFGHRFNRNKVLIDPYALGNTATLWNRGAACGPEDNLATSMRSVDHRPEGLRLGGRRAAQPADVRDGHLRDARRRLHALADLGCRRTRARSPARREDPVSEVARRHRGRAAAGLRVRRQEILPDEPDHGRAAAELLGLHDGQLLGAARRVLRRPPRAASHITEFRDMVKALHKAGIEVILDVVFNHTDRGEPPGADDQLQRASTTASTTTSCPNDQQYYRTTPAAATP